MHHGFKKMNNYPGTFVVLEGPDGSGKTTASKVLKSIFEERGHRVELTREPGGTALAEKIRNLVLFHNDPQEEIADSTELYLFAAARAQHLHEFVWPALRAGKLVICDRFNISTRVYQGHARSQLQTAIDLESLVHPDFQADLTLFFDIDLKTSLKRIQTRDKTDRFEGASLSFKTRLWDGYQFEKNRLITDNPNRIKTIDSDRTFDQVNSQLAYVADMFIEPYYENKLHEFRFKD